eukprot:3237682-Pleurochrysis_carterae.AAC.2
MDDLVHWYVGQQVPSRYASAPLLIPATTSAAAAPAAAAATARSRGPVAGLFFAQRARPIVRLRTH